MPPPNPHASASLAPPTHTTKTTNSAGKSTLLRLIMGREQPKAGRVSLGEHGIVPNYFEQNQAEALDLNLTVLDTLVRAAPDAQLNDLKQLLGRMLFSGSAMDKKVKVLSGGEKARLALAKFMCTQGTLVSCLLRAWVFVYVYGKSRELGAGQGKQQEAALAAVLLNPRNPHTTQTP